MKQSKSKESPKIGENKPIPEQTEISNSKKILHKMKSPENNNKESTETI